MTHAYLRFCDSCGVEYGSTKDRADDSLLCYSCWLKREKDKAIKVSIGRLIENSTGNGKTKHTIDSYSLWSQLIPSLHEKEYPLEGYDKNGRYPYDRPEDFNKLAELSSPGNYIGLIYADGDDMGRELRKICSEDRMEKFAKAVDSGVYQAVVKAIVQHLQPAQRGSKADIRNEDKSKPWPFDILLLGGDDLVMVTRADSVLQVGLTVMEEFSRFTRQNYVKPLNLSVGITIAHANYPFGQLLQLGESALKFAKKQGAKRRQEGQSWEGGLLNFLVVSSANHLTFEKYYDGQLLTYAEWADEVKKNEKNQNLYRSLRPYTAADFHKLIKAIRSPQIQQIPRSKLQQLRQALFQNKTQAMLNALTLLFHWRSQKQKEAILKLVQEDFIPPESKLPILFPWFQIGQGEDIVYKTPLLDMIEIFDFIPKEDAHE